VIAQIEKEGTKVHLPRHGSLSGVMVRQLCVALE
jgi:hypothetical protein